MTQKHLQQVAKLEAAEWQKGDRRSRLPAGLVMAVLFAFVHRATTGNTVEETFFPAGRQELDWEI